MRDFVQGWIGGALSRTRSSNRSNSTRLVPLSSGPVSGGARLAAVAAGLHVQIVCQPNPRSSITSTCPGRNTPFASQPSQPAILRGWQAHRSPCSPISRHRSHTSPAEVIGLKTASVRPPRLERLGTSVVSPKLPYSWSPLLFAWRQPIGGSHHMSLYF